MTSPSIRSRPLSIALYLLICASFSVTFISASTRVVETGASLAPFPLTPPRVLYQASSQQTNDNTIVITPTDQTKLKTGEMVQKKWQGGRVVSIQDIEAPADTVMATILDYNNYKNRAPSVNKSELTRREVVNNQVQLYVHFAVGPKSYEFNIYSKVTHVDKTVAWTLDEDKKSDFLDNVGYWHVEPHSDQQRCRLYYSTESLLHPRIPSFATKLINKSATNDGPKWVKKYSERPYCESKE